MSKRARMQAFYKRWDIPQDPAEEFARFVNRLLDLVDWAVGDFFVTSEDASRAFFLYLGKNQPARPMGYKRRKQVALVFKRFRDHPVYKSMREAGHDQLETIRHLQALLWVFEKADSPKLDDLVKAVNRAIDLSPTVHIRLRKQGNSVAVCPAGAKLLDEACVNETLAWLVDDPKVAERFQNALDICLRKDSKQYRNLLDELRVALETLVRRVLGNRRNLENQQEPLGQWMEQRGVHTHVRNMYCQLLRRFALYQNDAVKHGEEWSPLEVEFMIYLTGTFMRLLLEAKGK